MHSKFPRFLAVASAFAFTFSSVRAEWTGAAGNNLVDDPANWADGVIDGVFAPTLTGNLTLQAASDVEFAGGLSFTHASDFSLIIEPSAITTRTFVLGGDVNVDIAGNSSSKVVRLGASSGSRPIVLDLGGGVRTFTVNAGLAATATGRDTLTLWGDVTNGGMIKTGGGTLEFNNALSLSGSYVNEGGYTLLQNSASMLSVDKVVVGGSSGRFVLKGTASNRLNDSAAVHLTGGIFGYQNVGGSSVENIGTVYLQGARSAIGLTSGTLHVAELVRDQYSTVALVGSSLTARFGEGSTKFTVGSDANILSSLTGGEGANGTTTVSILPWATATTAISNSFTDSFDSRYYSADFGFVTYTSGGGFRALNKTTEYAASLASSANVADNVRLTATETLAGNQTVNSLFMDTGASSLNLGGNILNITSGALATGNHQISITNGTLNFGAKTGYVMTGRNNSNAIGANFTGSAGVVFGITPDQTLALSGKSTYAGRTVVNSGTLALGVNDTLPTGTAVRVDKTATLQVNNNVSQQVAAIAGSGVARLNNSGARLDIGDSVLNSAAGMFTVGSGGSVSAGDDSGYHRVGQLTFTGGSLRFEAGSTLNIEIAAPDSFDSINLSTAGKIVTIDGGTLSLNFIDGYAPQTGDTFQIFSIAGLAVLDSVLTPENFNIVSNIGYAFSLDGTGLLIVGAAIPEPSAFAMLAAFSALGFAGARRRRRI